MTQKISDIIETTHELKIVPQAGYRNAPDVWCKEALVYLADDLWGWETSTMDTLRRSSIWRGAPLATYECWEGLLPDTGDIILVQAKNTDSRKDRFTIAGLYRVVDSVPVWLIVSKRCTKDGSLAGFIYHAGSWEDSARQSLRRVAAIDSAVKKLRREIEDSMPMWQDIEHHEPKNYSEARYIARMKYLRDAWEEYSGLVKAVIEATWERTNLEEAVGRAKVLAALASSVAPDVAAAADDIARLLSVHTGRE